MPKNRSNYSQGERWHLLYQYFITHGGKGRPITFDNLRDCLLAKGIEVHPNTLYADIAALQGGVFGLKIDFDRHLNGGAGAWVLENPLFEPNEIRMIIDSIQASKFITENEVRNLTNKMLAFTDEATTRSVGKYTIVADRIKSMNDSAVKGADRIYEAIATDRKIGFKVFHYERDGRKKYSKDGKIYIVSPFATIWMNGYYYLYAYVDGRNKFDYFRIDRMDNITKPMLETRDGKSKFDKSPLKNRGVVVFSIKPAKDYENVKIRFNNGLVDVVRDKFGKDIVMIPDGEDNFIISATVRASTEFYAWLFAFGRGAKILSPDDLANKMRDYAKNVYDMYINDGEM